MSIWTSQRMESGKTDSVKCSMGLKWGMQFVLVAVGTSFVLLDPSNNVHLGIHQSWQLSPHLFEWELIYIRWQLKNMHCNKLRTKCILGHIAAIYISKPILHWWQPLTCFIIIFTPGLWHLAWKKYNSYDSWRWCCGGTII